VSGAHNPTYVFYFYFGFTCFRLCTGSHLAWFEQKLTEVNVPRGIRRNIDEPLPRQLLFSGQQFRRFLDE
jgi:hypothetical protein